MRMVVVALSIAALLLSGDRMTFAQPASRPPVMRLEEGRITALQKKTASCRTEGAGKGRLARLRDLLCTRGPPGLHETGRRAKGSWPRAG